MIISVSSQMTLFLLSMAIGGIFGLVYDVLYLGRLLVCCGKFLSFVCDCLYLSACGVFTFLFLLAGNAGEVRLFVLEGELLGFLLYRLTLGGPVAKAVRWLAVHTRHTAAEVGRQLRRPAMQAGRKLGTMLSPKRAHFKKSNTQDRKVVQRRLKPACKVMYNLFYKAKARHKAAKSVARKKEPFRGEDQ